VDPVTTDTRTSAALNSLFALHLGQWPSMSPNGPGRNFPRQRVQALNLMITIASSPKLRQSLREAFSDWV
jgi:hypothetical protein